MKTWLKNIIKKSWIRNLLILVAGLFLGWLLFGRSSNQQMDKHAEEQHVHQTADGTTWTCSMHPQIKEDEPGQCPICGMDLIPMEAGGEDALLVNQLQMTEGAAMIAEVQTSLVQKAQPTKELNLTGKIYPDESRIAELTARFPGRIEKLYVNFTGQNVKRGQRLASIYSPELLTAQKELFEAIKLKEYSPKLYEAARSKLRLWDLTETQIEAIEASGNPQLYFDILSPLTGTVTKREISLGDYVHEGMPLFEVVDLNRLWVMFDAYESDLPWIKLGDKISFTVQSQPGNDFSSKVSFIDPVIDPMTRVARVRVEVRNKGNLLKPEMFARGKMTASMPQLKDAILIPASAVLWTGKRAVVYVRDPQFSDPTFSYREVELGEEASGFYVVRKGLQAGEEVVTNGAFKIDAAAQLLGKPSMMNPGGGKISTGHNHGGESTPQTDHGQHQTQANSGMEPMKIENTSPVFISQLHGVYENYKNLTEALIAGDQDAAQNSSLKGIKALQKVDMSLVKGQAHNHWMELEKSLSEGLERINKATSIEDQRMAFVSIGEPMFSALRDFGTEEPIYYQFCPMANNDEGAYWLSSYSEIKNPYFGEAMLKCGETRNQLKPGK